MVLRSIFQTMCDYPWCTFFLMVFVLQALSIISDMFKKSHELENEIRKKMGAIGYEI